MILQCDQCKTKFRLDESKLKPGGVKVRCSKCRHVFLAGAEQKLEESEFDSILSGLGAPFPEKGEEGGASRGKAAVSAPAAPAAEPAASVDFDLGLAPKVPPDQHLGAPTPTPDPAESVDFGEFSFAEEPSVKEQTPPAPGETFEFDDIFPAAEPVAAADKTAAATDEKPAATGEQPAAEGNNFDFGEIEFDATPLTPQTTVEGTKAKEPFDFGEFSFDTEPVSTLQAPATPPKDNLDFGEFSFSEEPGPPAVAPGSAAPAPEAGESVGFGELSFPEEPDAEKTEPGLTAAGDGLDFGEFSFGEEPAVNVKEPTPPAASAPLDFGEFSFAEEPPPAKAAPAAPAGDTALDFGEFSFTDEPAGGKAKPPVAGDDALDFGEFSLGAAPKAGSAEPAPPAAGDGLDFGDFSFADIPAVGKPAVSAPAVPPAIADTPAAPAAPAALGGSDDFDFGSFSFAEEPVKGKAEQPPAASDTLDFGEFSFGGEPTAGKAVPPASPAGDLDFGDFSFAAEPAASPLPPAVAGKEAFDFDDFSFGEETPAPAVPAAAVRAENPLPVVEDKRLADAADVPDDFFALGEFSFSAEFPTQTVEVDRAPKPEPIQKKDVTPVTSSLPGATEASPPSAPAVPPVSPAVEAKKQSPQATLDFSFGAQAAPPAPEVADGEDFPPLAISSRRKGRSLLTVSVVTVSVLVIVALTGAGLYLLQSGPAAMHKFDQLGLGFVGKWFGMESPEEGRITVRNPLAAFHQNKEAGEIFVVNGEVVNSFSKARASIHVRVSLFDKKGAVIMQKTAYCGNKLSNEQLDTLPMAKLDSIMNNTFGDSLANLGVKPGHAIGFVVAMANVPKEAVDFGVEVVGSTIAGQ